MIAEIESNKAGLSSRLARARILDASPGKLEPWLSRNEFDRRVTLLELKTSIVSDGWTGIFKTKAQEWKGCQFGDAAQHPEHILLELYGPNNRCLHIILSTEKDSRVNIGRPGINHVRETLDVVDSGS